VTISVADNSPDVTVVPDVPVYLRTTFLDQGDGSIRLGREARGQNGRNRVLPRGQIREGIFSSVIWNRIVVFWCAAVEFGTGKTEP
jgi:hypothetical protein